jgi:hypothetical protein
MPFLIKGCVTVPQRWLLLLLLLLLMVMMMFIAAAFQVTSLLWCTLPPMTAMKDLHLTRQLLQLLLVL